MYLTAAVSVLTASQVFLECFAFATAIGEVLAVCEVRLSRAFAFHFVCRGALGDGENEAGGLMNSRFDCPQRSRPPGGVGGAEGGTTGPVSVNRTDREARGRGRGRGRPAVC